VISLPLVSAAPLVALVLNVALWASAQVLAGYRAHRLPLDRLQDDRGLLRLRRFEDDGRWYERTLRIGRWKDRLPEAGAFFDGGITKRTLPGRSEGGLERFAAETRRAEIAHWTSFACLPLCLIWNDAAGVALMVAYGLVFNLPLIAIQRHNRGRVERILRRRAARSSQPEHR
jgi:glycosyl-4,4'-diaponeurosporenoate acyltransferase